MPHAKKIVLHCPTGYAASLDALVEQFIQDGVILVAVVGKDCAKVEDIIDELVVGNGDREYDLLTSSHPNASVEEAVEFAKSLTLEFKGDDVEVVEL